jgi:hypothetical protein
MRLADLKPDDKFYFDQDVSQNTLHPTITQWEFIGPAHTSRGYWVAQVDQTRPFGEKPKSENPGEVLVRRISYQ